MANEYRDSDRSGDRNVFGDIAKKNLSGCVVGWGGGGAAKGTVE